MLAIPAALQEQLVIPSFYFISSSSTCEVSTPTISTTFTIILYLPAFLNVCGAVTSSIFGFFLVRKDCHKFSKI